MIRSTTKKCFNRPVALLLFATALIAAGCSDTTSDPPLNDEGGVFVMSNKVDANTIVAYRRANDGTLTRTGEFVTGGMGGIFDGGEGIDPLISAYSLLNTPENDYLMVVNAGSNTVSVMRVNADMTLELVDTESTQGTGPNSIAYRDGYVFVSNIDSDGVFENETDQQGSITGFSFSNGELSPLEGSTRNLPNRPAAIRFSPDGDYLIASGVNAGSAGLASANNDSLIVFGIDDNGIPTETQISGATSTEVGNAENRNLPTIIGFDVVNRLDRTFVIAAEAREFRSQGEPPAFPDLQTGSVSVFELGDDGVLSASQLDVLAGQSVTQGQRTTCWVVMSPDGVNFWVANALEATISSYQFTDSSASIELLDMVAAVGTQPTSSEPSVAFETTDGFVDLDISDDGRFLYQLYGGSGVVGVYAVAGGNLTLVEEVSGDLPDINTQGLVSF